jgi:hypothetical protein
MENKPESVKLGITVTLIMASISGNYFAGLLQGDAGDLRARLPGGKPT